MKPIYKYFLVFLFVHPGKFSWSQLAKEGRTAYALIVSVPFVDNQLINRRYNFSEQPTFQFLPGAIKDGKRIETILEKEGFPPANIIRLGTDRWSAVTSDNIMSALIRLGTMVKNEDLFVFYYSGHGFQVKDQPGGDEKLDHEDEVLVTYDGFLLDDSINAVYQRYFKKTRNVMIVDACHAGTTYKVNLKSSSAFGFPYHGNVDCNIVTESNVDESINMLYYGASLDENNAYDNGEGGYFTRALFSLYNQFWRSYTPEHLACEISRRMKGMNDQGNGLIQYAELGKLSEDFKESYLFKIK